MTTHADPTPAAGDAPALTAQPGKIVCNACPVLCQISAGRAGACDRYANIDGVLSRVDPLLLMARTLDERGAVVPFADGAPWDGGVTARAPLFVTGVGSGTTYPDYKPRRSSCRPSRPASTW